MHNLVKGQTKIQFTPLSAPIVSVIVPCYNYGHLLAETLENLLAQSWQNWECIIVDDGSTDSTRQVSDKFLKLDSRFKYIYQTNKGLSAARNAGIGVCKGSYIQFLDADDMLEEKKLEKHVAYLENHPDTDIVYGHVRYFKVQNAIPITAEMSKYRRKRMPQVSGVEREILFPLVRGNIMVVNAALLRKAVIDDVDGFNQSLCGHEDWDFWIRCALAGKRFQYIKEGSTLALVRVHHSSMSKNVLPMLMSNLKVRKQLQNSTLPSDLCKENGFQIGLTFARIAHFEFVNGKLLLGLQHAVLAIWCEFLNISISNLLQLFTLLLPEKTPKE